MWCLQQWQWLWRCWCEYDNYKNFTLPALWICGCALPLVAMMSTTAWEDLRLWGLTVDQGLGSRWARATLLMTQQCWALYLCKLWLNSIIKQPIIQERKIQTLAKLEDDATHKFKNLDICNIIIMSFSPMSYVLRPLVIEFLFWCPYVPISFFHFVLFCLTSLYFIQSALFLLSCILYPVFYGVFFCP